MGPPHLTNSLPGLKVFPIAEYILLFCNSGFFPTSLSGCQDLVYMIQMVPSSQSSTCKAINSLSHGGSVVASFVLGAEQDYRGSPGWDGGLSRMTSVCWGGVHTL